MKLNIIGLPTQLDDIQDALIPYSIAEAYAEEGSWGKKIYQVKRWRIEVKRINKRRIELRFFERKGEK